MNYRQVKSIRFKGAFDPKQMEPWFKRYPSFPMGLRLANDGSYVGIELDRFSLEEKREMIKHAIQNRLPMELLIDDGNKEYPLPIPQTNPDHPVLSHQERGRLSFIKIASNEFTIYLADLRPDQLLNGFKSVINHLKETLKENSSANQVGYFQAIQSKCFELKKEDLPVEDLIKRVIQHCKAINLQCQNEQRPPIEATALFQTEVKQLEVGHLDQLLADGGEVGLAYVLFILFISLKPQPMLQEVALVYLNQVIEELKETQKKSD